MRACQKFDMRGGAKIFLLRFFDEIRKHQKIELYSSMQCQIFVKLNFINFNKRIKPKF
jgi:hypothetical protein